MIASPYLWTGVAWIACSISGFIGFSVGCKLTKSDHTKLAKAEVEGIFAAGMDAGEQKAIASWRENWSAFADEMAKPLPVGPAYPDIEDRLELGAAQCPFTEAA